MKEALEGEIRFYPSDAKAAVVLEPSDGAFDGPASFVASQGSTILGSWEIAFSRTNHINRKPPLRPSGIPCITTFGNGARFEIN